MPARGIIAIGKIANGIIAIGQIAMGLIAIGQLGIGIVLGIAQASFGAICVGQLALGVLYRALANLSSVRWQSANSLTTPKPDQQGSGST